MLSFRNNNDGHFQNLSQGRLESRGLAAERHCYVQEGGDCYAKL